MHVRALLAVLGGLLLPQGDARADQSFPKPRTEYLLNANAGATDVIDKSTGALTRVPFGEAMIFNGAPKYSKDTRDLLQNIRAHSESYAHWDQLADLPVDFLRTGLWYEYEGGGWGSGQLSRTTRFRFPDRANKVVVAYVNATEFSGVGDWDPSFNPRWDVNGDDVIDPGVANLPPYVDVNVFNADWKNYVSLYWTEAWRDQLRQKIDFVAAQHFDGLMLDVMTGYWTWANTYPGMDVSGLRQQTVELFRWISAYARTTYGSAFVVTVNLDPDAKSYFGDLGVHIDAGYYQNAFFEWNGSGVVNGYGVSTNADRFTNPAIDYVKAQGLAVLDMDHLGIGTPPPGLNFQDFNDRITAVNLLKLFRWALESGSTPFAVEVFMGPPYALVPRFVRVLANRPGLAGTAHPDWVIGSGAADTIDAGGGDDTVAGLGGADLIDGGSGTNTAVFVGARASFDVFQAGDVITIVDRSGREGVDTLRRIQFLQFADQLVPVGTATAPPGRPVLTVTAVGTTVFGVWSPGPGGPPSSYVAQVGTAAGASDVLDLNVGLALSGAGVLPPGTYYIRIIAINPGGSAISDEVVVRVGS
jgi:endo-alpha-1,4-polygalactosaminidase (GH114 family)